MGCGASRSKVSPYTHGSLTEKIEKLDQQVQTLTATVEELKGRLTVVDRSSSLTRAGSEAKVQARANGRLCTASEHERAKFLEHKWLPFINELRGEICASRARAVGGFSPEEILAPQSKMQGWSDRCLELTAEWHGRPNLSVMYEFLVESATLDPSTPYKFEAVPHKRSADNWVRVIDGEVRGSFYKPTNDDAHESMGGIKQTVGESAIANTQLSGIMSAAESRLLLAGGTMKTFLVKKLASKQRKILLQLGEALRGAEAANCGLSEYSELCSLSSRQASPDKRADFPPARLSDMLNRCETALLSTEVGVDVDAESGSANYEKRLEAQQVLANAMTSTNIDCDGLAWIVLRDLGSVIASYGQLSKSQKVAIHGYLKAEMGDTDGADNEQHDEVDKFVQFCRDHPGSMYKNDPILHKQMMLAVSLTKKYKVVSRNEVEKHTVHRFLPTEWVRSCPLMGVQQDGTVNELRPAGAEEQSRFRANKFPYSESHGIGLSGGGLDVSLASMVGKTEAQIKREAGAKLKNWWLTDIEKVLVEGERLNPATKILLPFECFHETGQNVKAASSIGATQHSQINRSELVDWPVLQLQHRPVWVKSLDATIDIVQVGELQDAFYVKLVTARPSHPNIVKLLTELRVLLLHRYGAKGVDFDVHCVVATHFMAEEGAALGDHDEGLDYVVTFNPVAAIEKVEGNGYLFRNTASGDLSSEYNIPVQTVDSSQGKGNMMVWGKSDWDLGLTGRAVMERLYDFNAVPGIRKVVRNFLMTKIAFVDSAGKAEISPSARAHGGRCGGDEANISPVSEW